MKILGVFLILVLFTLSVWGEKTIDLSERILKPGSIHGLGNIGFGLYDVGDNKYKILDWKFNLKSEFPIQIGEGKAEIKDQMVNAYIFKNNIYIYALNDRKVNVFDLKGKFIKDFKFDSPTIYNNLLKCFRNKTYKFNPAFFIENNRKDSEFFKILDPETLKVLEVIFFKDKLKLPKINGVEPAAYIGFFQFDVDNSLNIYVLDPINDVIFRMTKEGKILSKTNLPYKTEIKFVAKKNGEKRDLIKQAINLYCSFRVIHGEYYVIYEKLDYSSSVASDLDRSYLLKIKPDGSFLKKEFVGMKTILEINNGTMYLFDTGEFFITTVDLKTWK